MNDRRTNLLLLVLLLAAAATVLAWSRLGRLRDDAVAAELDLAECRAYLAEMAEAGAASPAARPRVAGATDINRRVREAATAAGAAEELTSIEPGNAETIGDVTELSVFLHFEPITLRELVIFLHHLSAGHAGMRAKTLELEAPPSAEQGDAWVADVAIGYPATPGEERAELR